MPDFTEAQMREDLEGALAVVFPWWALEGDERTWPGKLVSPFDLSPAGEKRVHGYVITPSRTYSVRENPNCIRQFFTYEIRGLRWYDDTRSIRRIAEGGEWDFRLNLNLYGSHLLHRSIGQITIEQV
jgi:hypothetical protein